ncbi:hypothetical protein BRADI_5g06504v3 [Brachypodium distachyon]|uniref:Uncharacterized protein n=1 Tax=Brachypodium distachyon TaxID=15368 RepID=A0A0Q3E771_BRADI|nr:hypothetical protein BRADI_5g06504v3 [Brachypodium distachyon]
MAATAMMAKLVVVLLFLTQIFGLHLAAAARPLQEGHGAWMENGIEMLTQLLGGSKSGSNGRGHCC